MKAVIKMEVTTNDFKKLKDLVEGGYTNLPFANLMSFQVPIGKIQKVTCEEEISLSGDNS